MGDGWWGGGRKKSGVGVALMVKVEAVDIMVVCGCHDGQTNGGGAVAVSGLP